LTDEIDIPTILQRTTEILRPQLARNPLMIGIHTGGTWIAEYLHEMLGLKEPLGALDISFYRDDFTRIGFNPQVRTSSLPVNIDDRHIILVDDVLHTGRTIRAAMNEIFDFGRPASIRLIVLIERDGRELPIQPDVAGASMKLERNQHIKLTRTGEDGGPETLRLSIQEVGA